MKEDRKKEREIKELKYKIEVLEQKIEGLEKDLDYQIEQNSTNGNLRMCIRELQEEVAKMANQPVGIMFSWLK